MIDNHLFYNRLKKHHTPLHKLLGNEKLFKAIPEDWHVIVADIKNSTQAVRDGLHQQVNLAATGTIVSVLNEIKTRFKSLNIPYFFGGDGVTFIVPDVVCKTVLEVLENYRHHVKNNFNLTLKVGAMPIHQIYSNGLSIKIARVVLNTSLTLPIVLGNGLKYAERKIKASFVDEVINPAKISSISLEGMECRWKEIDSPTKEEKIVCLLVHCQDESSQSEVYSHTISTINKIFGNYKKRHPISIKKLKLDLSIKKMKDEMYARLGKRNVFYFLKNWLTTIIGKFYFIYFKEGRDYLKMVKQLSYTLMIDGTLNLLIAGKEHEIEQLKQVLDKLEQEDKIKYGIHITHASIMSCYVQDRQTNHIHFIDGAEGGYTAASRMFKSKMNKN